MRISLFQIFSIISFASRQLASTPTFSFDLTTNYQIIAFVAICPLPHHVSPFGCGDVFESDTQTLVLRADASYISQVMCDDLITIVRYVIINSVTYGYPVCSTCKPKISRQVYIQTDIQGNLQSNIICCNADYSRAVSNTLACVSCSTNCATCTDFTLACTSCQPGYVNIYIIKYLSLTTATEGNCLSACALTQYSDTWPQGGQYCVNCVSPCIQCTSATACTICDSSTATPLLYQSSCVATCPTSYYITPIVSNPSYNQCLPCDSNCYECTTSSTHCQNCYPGKYLYNNTCIAACPDGYYSQNVKCFQCQQNCQNCLDQNHCTLCSVNYYFTNTSICDTTCPQGFYGIAIIRSCNTCHETCQRCIGPLVTDCTTCNSPLLFYNIINTNGQCLQQCKLNQYKSGNQCLQCPTQCSVCSNSTTCTYCASGYYRRLDGSCQSTCDTGWTLVGDTCQKCDTTCASCNAILSTSCQSCSGSLSLYQNSCITICPIGTSSVSNVCINCNTGCLTCINAVNCLTCQTGLFYTLPAQTCTSTCGSFYYENRVTFQCQNCPSNCQSCYLQVCLKCYNSYLDIDGICRTTCNAGYYADSSTGTCSKCDSTCLLCTSGGLNNCTTCSGALLFSYGYCLPICPKGQFQSGINCLNCDLSCNECITSATNCTSCVTTYLQGNHCVSSCSSLYYTIENIKQCLSCNSACLTCYGPNSNQCLSCPGGQCLYLNQCQATCGALPTINPTCSYQCITCQYISTNCLSCAANRMGVIPACQCPDQYLEVSNQAQCQQCSNNCLRCTTTASNCVVCKGDRISAPSCICPQGYYDDQINLNCKSCKVQCLSCSSFSICTQCRNQRILDVNSNCICPIGYYEQYTPFCGQCGYQCQSCVGFSNVCTTCSGIRVTAPICICPDGYYDNGITCLICDITCKTCDSFGCITCSANRVGPVNGVCDCPTGAFSQLQFNTAYCSDCSIAIPQAYFDSDLNGMHVDFQTSLISAFVSCDQVIAAATLSKLGLNPSCSVALTRLNVAFGLNTQILLGDTINLIPAGLKGSLQSQVCSAAFQQIISPQIKLPIGSNINQFLPTQSFVPLVGASVCISYPITFNNQIYNGMRNFTIIQWGQTKPVQDNNKNIIQVLQAANNANPIQNSISFAPFTLNVSTIYTFTVLIQNFLNQQNLITFSLDSGPSVSVQIVPDSNNSPTHYRYDLIQYNVMIQYTNCSSEVPTDSVELSIIWSLNNNPIQSNAISGNPLQFTSTQTLTIQPMTLTYGNYNITVSVFQVNNTLLQRNYLNMTIIASLPKVTIKGGNKQYGSTQDILLQVVVSNPDYTGVEQSYTVTWSCQDLTQQSECYDLTGELIPMGNLNNQTIKGKRLTPYTAYQISTITYFPIQDVKISSFCLLYVIELDLPILEYSATSILNYYDQSLLQFTYSGSNPDTLTYAGAVVYNFDVQTTFPFYYLWYQFKLWNYFIGLNSTIGDNIQIRASVYNPKYYLPSIATIPFTMNIPPSTCQLQVSPTQIIEFQTLITITIVGCPQNQYKYSIYSDPALLQYDILTASNLNQYILQDYTNQSLITTLLYYSNSSSQVIMVSIQDQFLGITNLTQNISVSINPNLTETIFDQYVQQSQTIDSQVYAYGIVTQRLLSLDGFHTYKYQILVRLQNLQTQDAILQSIIQKSISALSSIAEVQDIIIKTNQSLITSSQINTSISSTIQTLQYLSNLQMNNVLSSSGNQLYQTQMNILATQIYQVTSLMKIETVKNTTTQVYQLILNQTIASIYPLMVINQAPFQFQSPQFNIQIYYSSQLMLNQLLGNILSSQESLNRRLLTENTSYYKYRHLNYSVNPYYTDPDFPKNSSGYQASDNLLTYADSNESVSLKQNALIQFQITKKYENSTYPQCISKYQGSWNVSICKSTNSADTLNCSCQSLNPTSIINQIEFIGEGISEVFTADAISQLDSFPFYETIIFYFISISTIVFIFIARYLQKLDIMQNKQETQVTEKTPPTSMKQIFQQDNYLTNRPTFRRVTYKTINIEPLKSPSSEASEQPDVIKEIKERKKGLFDAISTNQISKIQAYLKYLLFSHQITSVYFKYDPDQSRVIRLTVFYNSLLSSLAIIFRFGSQNSISFNTWIYIILASIALLQTVGLVNKMTINYFIALIIDNVIYSPLQICLFYFVHMKIIQISFLQVSFRLIRQYLINYLMK